MRAVRCWCEELVVSDDDDALARELAAHVREAHPGEPRGEGEIRERVAAKAEDAPDRPPWPTRPSLGATTEAGRALNYPGLRGSCSSATACSDGSFSTTA